MLQKWSVARSVLVKRQASELTTSIKQSGLLLDSLTTEAPTLASFATLSLVSLAPFLFVIPIRDSDSRLRSHSYTSSNFICYPAFG